MANLGSLPEELIHHIFTFLDDASPSVTLAADEPLLLRRTLPRVTPLKSISVVCKNWRRIVLPKLFKKVRFRLTESSSRPKTCIACAPDSIQDHVRNRRQISAQLAGVHDYHIDMVNDAIRNLTRNMVESDDIPHVLADDEVMTNITTWVPQFYHDLCTFLDFVASRGLNTKIDSFTFFTEQMLTGKLDRYPHRAAPRRDWRYRAVAAFWQHLFSAIDPKRISIMAPPMDLACLTLSAIDTFGDWAFGDMEYHMLTLEREGTSSLPSDTQFDYRSLSYVPLSHPGVAKSSILNLREWTSAHLNEGSFLAAYGTYEYFERGPPTVIHSINPYVSRRITPQPVASFGLRGLRRLTYTAIFPFSNHVNFHDLLNQLEVLDVRLAPAENSNILREPARVGKAQMSDCWSELQQIYQSIALRLSTIRITAKNTPNLKTFICRDYHYEYLRDDLDDIFTMMCLPVWVEHDPGMYSRVSPDGHTNLGSHPTQEHTW